MNRRHAAHDFAMIRARARYGDDPVRELLLKEALEADGFEVPPRSAEERLRELRTRDRVR